VRHAIADWFQCQSALVSLEQRALQREGESSC
jgi:hypothetical protein